MDCMETQRHQIQLIAAYAVLLLGCGIAGLAAADADASRLPAGFLDRLVKDDPTLRLTLPNGKVVMGKIERIQMAEREGFEPSVESPPRSLSKGVL
jgi:hypothetical protein